MLNLIGNPNETIKVPGIFLDFIKGIEIIVNLYLKIGFSKVQASNRFIAPTGNTILHIFGTWLFDAIHMNRTGFEDGTSLAVKTLITIMSTKHETDFLPIYLSNFYSCMQLALATESSVLVTTIITAQPLLTSTLKGVRCLIPSFVDACYKVCTSKVKVISDFMTSEQVRKSCLGIIGCLISLPNQFSSTKFFIQNSIASKLIVKANNYSELKPYISNLLLETLDIENNDRNLEVLLGLTFVWQNELIKESSDFIKKAIKLILKKIKHNQWIPSVISRALRSLIEMSNLFPNLPSKSSVLLANSIVETLCRYIISISSTNIVVPNSSAPPGSSSSSGSSSNSSQAQQPSQQSQSQPSLPSLPSQQTQQVQQIEDIIVLSYQCITSWFITSNQWILEYNETKKVLLSSIVIGLTYKSLLDDKNFDSNENASNSSSRKSKSKDKRKDQDKLRDSERNHHSSSLSSSTSNNSLQNLDSNQNRIQIAAKQTLYSLFNHLGNFPPASGCASYSTLATEEEILQSLLNNKQNNNNTTPRHSVDESKQFVRYFITDDHLLICIIDHLDGNEKPTVSVIVRDQTGRYTWDASLSYLPLSTPQHEIEEYNEKLKQHGKPLPIQCKPFEFENRKTLTTNDVSNVLHFFTEKGNQFLNSSNSNNKRSSQSNNPPHAIKMHPGFYLDTNDQNYQKTSSFRDIEMNQLHNKDFHLNYDIAMERISDSPVKFVSKNHQSRMFLSHLGFLSLENRDKLYSLPLTPNLFNLLRQLDQQAERTCVPISVLYIPKGQTNDDHWFTNECGNLDYQEFIATLGWGVDIIHHKGFSGTLDKSGTITGRTAPYWSSFNTEIIFQVCTLMPNNLSLFPDYEHKKKHSIHGHCIVIWIENPNDFTPQSIWKRLRHSALLICISPLDSGLYQVRLHTKAPETVNFHLFYFDCFYLTFFYVFVLFFIENWSFSGWYGFTQICFR